MLLPPRGKPAEWAALLGCLAAAALLGWLCHAYPASLPAVAPWDFAPGIFLACALALVWYARGLLRSTAGERPSAWRAASFAAGVLAIYAVLDTRFEYLALHMFFLNRIQHVVMHHVGPFLVALAWPGPTLLRGMPPALPQYLGARPLRVAVRAVQQPLVAAFLFVALFYLWLVPSVHFRAMIDPSLYAVMNWSMVVDGLLFWALVLDPRPCPPARVSFAARAALSLGVMFPQIALGAFITFATRDLYPFYALCGRVFPDMSALSDQHVGGIVIWIPPAMMSVLGLLAVLDALRRHDERIPRPAPPENTTLAARWTGR